MDVPLNIPAVWVHTTGPAFNAMRGGGYAAFLSPADQARLERIRQATMLFDGKHEEYYLGEHRTQFRFAQVLVGNQLRTPYLKQNVLKLISLKGADLLFGEAPMIRVDDEPQQSAIDALVDRCNLHAKLYGAAVDASYQAECFLEACLMDGQVYLDQVPADEIYPVGNVLPDGQFASYVRRELQDVGVPNAPIWLLLETTYSAGSIDRTLYQLGGDENRTKTRLALDQWPLPAGKPPLLDHQPTGVAANTITWIPNLLVRGKPLSDYDGVLELQDALNAKNTQMGVVLMKHADPKIAFPEEAGDESGNIQGAQDAFFYREPERIPKQIVWDAKLDPAMLDRNYILNQLLVMTETSPVLLGLKEGAAPDAYKKVRLESFNSLTKAARKAAYWKAGIRRAIGVAQDLEQTLPGVSYIRYPIGVELRDGIPQDTGELAQEISLLRAAGVMSPERGVELQIPDPAAQKKELSRIEAAHAAATPSILMSEPPAGPQYAADETQHSALSTRHSSGTEAA